MLIFVDAFSSIWVDSIRQNNSHQAGKRDKFTQYEIQGKNLLIFLIQLCEQNLYNISQCVVTIRG